MIVPDIETELYRKLAITVKERRLITTLCTFSTMLKLWQRKWGGLLITTATIFKFVLLFWKCNQSSAVNLTWAEWKIDFFFFSEAIRLKKIKLNNDKHSLICWQIFRNCILSYSKQGVDYKTWKMIWLVDCPRTFWLYYSSDIKDG